MDSISINGAPVAQRVFNQDEFDHKFNYVTAEDRIKAPLRDHNRDSPSCYGYAQKSGRLRGLISRFLARNWPSHSGFIDFFPVLKWVIKYDVKSDLPRDLLGALLFTALFIPQGVAAGILSIEDPLAGIYVLVIAQLAYPLLGSSRHSSLGAMSFIALMVRTSNASTTSSAPTLALVTAVIYFALGVIPWADSLLGLMPPSLLSGFSSSLFFRILFFYIQNTIKVELDVCKQPLNQTSIKDCAMTAINCRLLGLSVSSLALLLLAHWLFEHKMAQRVSFTPPYQLAVMILAGAFAYFVDLRSLEIRLLPSSKMKPKFAMPLMTNIPNLVVDGVGIALFAISLHFTTSQAIATEKMYKIDKKQEMLSFSVISAALAFLGGFPTASAHGKAQLNVETARFSLVSNMIAAFLVSLVTSFGGHLLEYVPYCVVAGVMVSSFPGLTGGFKHLLKLRKMSYWDAAIWTVAGILGLFSPSIAQGFLLAVLFAAFTIVIRLQRPSHDVLVRLSPDNYYGERGLYDTIDWVESHPKVFRFNAPLIFANVDEFRVQVTRESTIFNHTLSVGLGTRAGSFRSQIGPKDSFVRSSNNLTNIVIHPDNSPSPSAMTETFKGVFIFDCSSMSEIDSLGAEAMTDIYFELLEKSVRVIFAATQGRVRDRLLRGGFFERVPRSAFFPTVADAAIAVKSLLLPIPTSVSMNGCREVITLSTATSNHEDLATELSPAAV